MEPSFSNPLTAAAYGLRGCPFCGRTRAVEEEECDCALSRNFSRIETEVPEQQEWKRQMQERLQAYRERREQLGRSLPPALTPRRPDGRVLPFRRRRALEAANPELAPPSAAAAAAAAYGEAADTIVWDEPSPAAARLLDELLAPTVDDWPLADPVRPSPAPAPPERPGRAIAGVPASAATDAEIAQAAAPTTAAPPLPEAAPPPPAAAPWTAPAAIPPDEIAEPPRQTTVRQRVSADLSGLAGIRIDVPLPARYREADLPRFVLPRPCAARLTRLRAAWMDVKTIAVSVLLAAGAAEAVMRVRVLDRPFLVHSLLPAAIAGTILLAAVYVFLGLLLCGATPGMKRYHLIVWTYEDRFADRNARWRRAGASALSLLAGGVGYLWMLIDSDRLTWHDQMSSTYLIEEPGLRADEW